MLPALTNCPSARLAPNLFDSESLPFFVDPTPFCGRIIADSSLTWFTPPRIQHVYMSYHNHYKSLEHQAKMHQATLGPLSSIVSRSITFK